MASRGKLSRDLLMEDHPWLKKDLRGGHQVYRFSGYTYGVISPGGVAVSEEPGENPFFEVPHDAVDWDED